MPVTGVGIPMAPKDSDPLPIEQGGTAARTAPEARRNLDLPALTGGDNEFSNLNHFDGGAEVAGLTVDDSLTLNDTVEQVDWVSGAVIYTTTPPRISGDLVTAKHQVALEAQTGAIGATTLVAGALGKYMVVAYATVQTADAAAVSLTVNVIFTDPQGARTRAAINALSTAGADGIGGSVIANVASGNLEFSVTLGGVPGGTLDYDLEIDVVPV